MTGWAAIADRLVRAGLSADEVADIVVAMVRAEMAQPDEGCRVEGCHDGTIQNANTPSWHRSKVASTGSGRAAPAETLSDLAVARTALSVLPGLSRSAAATGAVVLDHFNTKTDVSCPSIARICRRSGYSRRSVLRALDELERAGLIDRRRHRGANHTNLYLPQFERMREIVVAFETTRAKGAANDTARAKGGAIGAIPGTQTLESKKDPPLTPQKDRRAKPRVPGQRELLLPITGGQGTPSRDVAEQKARGRVDNAIYDFARGSPDPGGTISRLMLENETAYSEALAAEIRQAGSGWQVLSARHGLAARSA